jgi:hypothetical protein
MELAVNGLAPGDQSEAATVQTLAPGMYTVVASSKANTSGIGLVEIYDLSAGPGSRLANISSRGIIGTDDNVLIGGFIVGDVANATVILRALGPSLASSLSGATAVNPQLSVFDSNGVILASNDNWQDDLNAAEVTRNGLAPGDPAEAAIVLHPPVGGYTVVVSDSGGASGIGLLEVYDLD